MVDRKRVKKNIVFFVAILVVCGVVITGVYFTNRAPNTWRPKKGQTIRYPRNVKLDAPITADDLLAFAPTESKLKALSGMTVEDRVEMAALLGFALNSFFEAEDEYPPYLFGATEPLYEFGSWAQFSPESLFYSYGNTLSNPDPLIQAGIIDGYPIISVWNEICTIHYEPEEPFQPLDRYPSHHDIFDPRLPMGDYTGTRWICMYSTPGDCSVLPQPYFDIVGEKFREQMQNGEGTFEESANSLEDRLRSTRLFSCCGKRASNSPNSSRDVGSYSVWSRPIEMALSESDPPDYLELLPSMPFFGYQRGEWFGSDECEAWIWFYGEQNFPAEFLIPTPVISSLTLDTTKKVPKGLERAWQYFAKIRPLQGLDLIDYSTGELTPDGIPDGICLLVKCKDGEILEVVSSKVIR